MLGSVLDGALERLYRAADLFAFPSTVEGFGLAALEALACGLPVVASDLDAFRTFMQHGRSALLVPVGDAEALGMALAQLAREPSACAALRAAGLQVAADYTWENAAVAHERVYSAVLRSIEPAGASRGAGA
jgi:phosphatidylinositol alpha-mannosyltransferase